MAGSEAPPPQAQGLRPDDKVVLAFDFEDGLISRIYAMRNPHKLGRLEEVAQLRR